MEAIPAAPQSSANNQNLLKPVPGRVDYNFFNYCAPCGLKITKGISRCPQCRQKVRTRPWHRSKVLKFKRI